MDVDQGAVIATTLGSVGVLALLLCIMLVFPFQLGRRLPEDTWRAPALAALDTAKCAGGLTVFSVIIVMLWVAAVEHGWKLWCTVAIVLSVAAIASVIVLVRHLGRHNAVASGDTLDFPSRNDI